MKLHHLIENEQIERKNWLNLVDTLDDYLFQPEVKGEFITITINHKALDKAINDELLTYQTGPIDTGGEPYCDIVGNREHLAIKIFYGNDRLMMNVKDKLLDAGHETSRRFGAPLYINRELVDGKDQLKVILDVLEEYDIIRICCDPVYDEDE